MIQHQALLRVSWASQSWSSVARSSISHLRLIIFKLCSCRGWLGFTQIKCKPEPVGDNELMRGCVSSDQWGGRMWGWWPIRAAWSASLSAQLLVKPLPCQLSGTAVSGPEHSADLPGAHEIRYELIELNVRRMLASAFGFTTIKSKWTIENSTFRTRLLRLT